MLPCKNKDKRFCLAYYGFFFDGQDFDFVLANGIGQGLSLDQFLLVLNSLQTVKITVQISQSIGVAMSNQEDIFFEGSRDGEGQSEVKPL